MTLDERKKFDIVNLADIKDQVQEVIEAFSRFKINLKEYAPQICIESADPVTFHLAGFTSNQVFSQVESLQIEFLLGDLGFSRSHEVRQENQRVRIWFRHSEEALELFLDFTFDGKYVPDPDLMLELDFVPKHLLNDRYWRGMLFLFNKSESLKPYLTEEYFNFKEGRVRFQELKERASVWSPGERVLVDLAANLFNDQQHDFNLPDLQDLDRQNFDLAQKAIRLRYGR